MKDLFINALHSKNKVKVTFFSKEDGTVITRLCAPMDYGPSRKASNKNDRFHLWDFESDKVNHPLSLSPDQVKEMIVVAEQFEPDEFVTWVTNWFVERDWGNHS